MVLQQESRLVKPELTAEVKGIYAGLVMVEANCSGVDSKQRAACHYGHQPELNNEQWQAPTLLHHDRAILHNHSDV